jgi:NTE family protein
MNQSASRRVVATFLLALSLPVAVGAQHEKSTGNTTSSVRPRVGLVLGGGGARGVAHIGVLRELERQRIPIDAIAGTSMGAIVGGLYASGMTTAELEQLVAGMDWAAALSDEPRRGDTAFRRKQDEQRFPVNPDVGFADGQFRLPRGIVQGQRLDLILQTLTADISRVEDFDDLHIPFRAVASDLETGEKYVMGHGDLGRAIRASMSVPGVLAPAEVDGRLLVDGGLVGNLPVDVVRDMGVDVVIAVDVEFPLYAVEDLSSAIVISEQMLTILVRKETLRQIDSLAATDVLIRPQLGNFGSADFGQVLDTIEPGVTAARDAEATLQRYSVDPGAYAAWQRHREDRQALPGNLAFVRVEHDSALADEVLESRLGVEPGDPIDPRHLSQEALLLHGLGVFEKVGYRLETTEEGTGVVFDARAKTWGPNFLRFGVTLEDDFEGATNFDLRARLTRPAVNRAGGEFRADLQLGTEPRIFGELYQPLRAGSRLFIAPYLDIDQANFNLFAASDVAARLRITELTGGVDFGTEIGNVGELRLGAFHGRGDSRVIVGDPAIPSPDFQIGGIRALLRFDTLDSPFFPRRGLRADAEWRQSRPGFGADERFDTVDIDIQSFHSWGRNTLGFGAEYSTTLSSDGALQNLFRLGGFHRLSGLERGAISGPHAALAKLQFYRRVGRAPGGLFEVPLYLGASLEAGNVWQSRNDISSGSSLLHGSLFLGMNTYIGPIVLGFGAGEGDVTNLYLFIGAPTQRRDF